MHCRICWAIIVTSVRSATAKGFSTIMKDCYPSGFPDSGWATDMKPVDVECSVCEGYGYTVKKMVPKNEVVDYVEES